MILWVAFGGMVVAFGISILATSLSRRVAVRLGMVDVPAGHKTHVQPTPLLGGCAIFVAVLAPSLLLMALAREWAATTVPAWLPGDLAAYVAGAADKAPMGLGILAGAFVLHVVGLLDDRLALGPVFKLAAQFLTSGWVVLFCQVRVLTMISEPLSCIVSILWLVTIINAFNFLDNMDGLAAGVAVICAAALLAAAVGLGQMFVAVWLCLLLGALLGFMPHNFTPAGSYMGDAGSLVVGFLLGVMSCLTTYVRPDKAASMYTIFMPLVLMAVPLYDMFTVIVLRVRDRHNLMVGDRRHFSHRLLRRGMSVRAAVLTVYLCTAATAIAASLLPHVSNWTGATLVFAQTALILLIIAMLESANGKP
ncbi:MAG: MraY family glycosyltransferase [Phycisphaerae bacterium]|nr:MraY family glycosyltransferase [Phycisphaerae bacterium]MDP7636162.1 MraY family glycosyltransferase [Phycisphaerae bacterium]